MKNNAEIMNMAARNGVIVPAFNIPYLPMVEPVVEALTSTDAFGFLDVARLEWIKFEAVGLRAVKDEYDLYKSPRHTRLHLDHIPVIDEDNLIVDYQSIVGDALDAGYDSVMVDGSRLPLEENIKATRLVREMAARAGVPAEGELGAVLGHEEGPLPPYEELFRTKQGFTSVDEARRFAEETEIDWLSVAIGNVHGAVSPATRTQEKLSARLDIDHLSRLREVTQIPLVLHGGSGIPLDYLKRAFAAGIAKINIGTDIRRVFERLKDDSVADAAEAVCVRVKEIVEELGILGSASVFNAEK